MGSSVNDCGGSVNHGTSGGDSKENSGCFTDSKDCHESDEKNGGNYEKRLHGGI